MRLSPLKRADAKDDPQGEYWMNERYQVAVRRFESEWGPCIELSIKRRDRKAIFDWRDIQWIKSQIAGEDCEGVQLFPRESRHVDNANQYWIYCFPGQTFPFGFKERAITERLNVRLHGNGPASVQRPFQPHVRPADLSQMETEAREGLKKAGLWQ